MMLVQGSHIMDHGKQEILYVWIPDDGSWQEPTVCNDSRPNTVTVTEHKNKDDSLCSRNLVSSSQLSTEVNMSETSTPNFVYKRRIIPKNADLPLSRSSKPTLVYKRRKVQNVIPTQVSANRPGLASKSGSIDGASLQDELIIEEQKSKLQKYSDLRPANDSCSSSKSNMDLGSALMKPLVDDVGECSSSGAPIVEGLGKDILETNSCISFLRHHGVLEERFSVKTSCSKKPMDVVKDICCLRSCKVCDRLTSTLKMLICDLCEEAFHMSCCSPAVKKVPTGDWFCHSCLRKKLKKLETNSFKSSMNYLGPIASMLRGVDPYASNVRIGKDFQAEVPDWSGPLTNELDDYSEPTEMSPLECASHRDWDSSNLSRLSSIGNWLQCREVVDVVNGTVCGKWRRAPLFEVQTDDWECFSSVFWDPTHADCAASQELDTDQVLKQLKYIEMLRPRLSAKRWKLGVQKGVDREEHTEDPKNTQKS